MGLMAGGSLTLLNTNAIACASDVIVPTAIEHFSLKSIDLLFSQVTRVKGNSSSIRMPRSTAGRLKPRSSQPAMFLNWLNSTSSPAP